MRMKRCLALLLIALLLPFCGTAEEETPAYHAGDTFSAWFEVTENPARAVAVSLRLEYDHSALELIPSNAVRKDSPILAPDLNGIKTGAGFEASFQVLSGAPGGVYEISVLVTAAWDLDENEVEGPSFTVYRARIIDLTEELAAMQAELDAAREENAALRQELENAKMELALDTSLETETEPPAENKAALIKGKVFLLSDYPNGKKGMVLSDGDVVTALESQVDENLIQWYRVRVSGQEGYVLGSHLVLPTRSFVENDFVCDIVGGFLVIRKYLGTGGVVSLPMPFFDYASSIRIGDSAFEGCDSLTKVEIAPYLIKSIGDSAFKDCPNLIRVNLSSSVQSIADNAFSGCSKKLLVIVEADSYAEAYCKEHGLKHKIE